MATAAQWWLQQDALLSPMLALAAPLLGGALFVLAGLYQWTPLKHACLRQCRSPFAFLLAQWRDGWSGALRMGAEHGLYCLGCCWILMALLFAVGVMNLLWVAVLAASCWSKSCCRTASGSRGLAGSPWPHSACGLRRRDGRAFARAQRSRSFGSSTSRSASPNRLTPNTVSAIARPGKIAIHGAVEAYSSAPPCSISPQAGVGSCTPRPR